MLDWAILIVCTVVVLFGMWKGYRWLRQEPEPGETAVVLPDQKLYPNLPQEAGTIRWVDSISAEVIAERVFNHERAQQRQERADALLQAVTMGHKPDQDEIDLLNEYFDSRRVNIAITVGAWSSTMKAIEDLTRDLEDLKAAQPTLIVAEMPERVG